jgi:hypothetical protein
LRKAPGAVLTIGAAATAIQGVEVSMIVFEQRPGADDVAVVAATNVRDSAIIDCEMRSKVGQPAIGIQLANTVGSTSPAAGSTA